MSLSISNSVVFLTVTCGLIGTASAQYQGTVAPTHGESLSKSTLTVALDHVSPTAAPGARPRTPESIDSLLAADLARRLSVDLKMVELSGKGVLNQSLENGGVDVALATQPGALAKDLGLDASIPLPYASAAMGIMRSDTDIKNWRDLKNRRVCVAEGSRYAGYTAKRFSAQEHVYATPTDSLIALRTGQCDVAVHEENILQELIKLPEWQKFSAILPAESRFPLVAFVREDDPAVTEAVNGVLARWEADRYLQQLTKVVARTIAFEVYAEQNIPDCH